MSVGSRIGSWFRNILRRERVESEMDAELRFHIEQRADDWMRDDAARAGTMTREEALRRARLEFGAVDKAKEECREARGASWLENLAQDLRFGLRTMRRSPGFTAVAILSLGLGIGANTAIFTLINDIVLKSLPVKSPEKLVAFGKEFGGGVQDGISGSMDMFTYDFYKQIQAHHEAFEDVTGYASFQPNVSVRLSTNAPVTLAVGHLVSGNFFSVLGAETILGRPLEPSDDNGASSRPVTVISYRYWHEAFGAAPDVIGKAITVNGTSLTIVGVTRPKFYGIELDENPSDMWIPIGLQPVVMLQPTFVGPGGPYWMHLMGRSKPGVSMAQAQTWVSLKLREYMLDREGATISPERRKLIESSYVSLRSGASGISNLRQFYGEPLRILMGIVVLVLLIACGNLANFLLAKTASREQEISTRLALGASRWRVVRQVLTESLLLSMCGGALGVALAYWGTSTMIYFVATDVKHMPFGASPDGRVLAFSLAVSLATGLLFGIGPAMSVARMGLAKGMKYSSRNVAGAGSKFGQRLPNILVAGQVAMSLVLLVGAGLFLRTLRNLETQNYGFNRTNLLLVNMDPEIAGYKEEQLDGFYQRVEERIGSLPRVQAVALSGVPPISHGNWKCPLFVSGREMKPDDDVLTTLTAVTGDYFKATQIPLVSGRTIEEQDAAETPKVVAINETLARHFFPDGNAIGKTVTFGDDAAKGEWRVVGIVKDAKYSEPRETPQRMIYLPVLQLSGPNRFTSWMEVRVEGDPALVASGVRAALAEIDPSLPVIAVRTIHDHLNIFTSEESVVSELSIFFALLALLLVCIGLYGVMTYSVVRRTNEIGIRMALGAQADGVLWMVLRDSVMVLAIGVAVGVPVTLAASRLVQSRLFGLSANDPLTLIAAVAGVSAVTLVCAYLPARRATKVDPMVALRYE
jgi:predicted permease